MSKEKKQAHLHWASDNYQQPCFCNSVVYLNTEKLKATPETTAAIFGIMDPTSISITKQDGQDQVIPLETATSDGDNGSGDTSDPFWNLEADQHYDVHTTSTDKVVPMNQIFNLLPGDNEDAKSDRLNQLSMSFYDKIWNSPEVPDDFTKKFFSHTSSSKIQGFRQFNWFIEVWGGPSLVGDMINTVLLPKLMAKHTASRMLPTYAMVWLKLMDTVIDEQFPSSPELKRAMGMYWLHFYAFFPYSDAERKEFREYVVSTWSS